MINIAKLLTVLDFLPEQWLLESYPPFLFMGVKVLSISADFRHLHVRLPARWYGRNMHGTIFGGWMAAVSDPLPALMCGRIFPGTEVWTKTHTIKFLRPAHGAADVEVVVSDEDVLAIQTMLDTKKRGSHVFKYFFVDADGKQIAAVQNTVFIRLK